MHANEPASASLRWNRIGSFLKVIHPRSCGIDKDTAHLKFLWDSLIAVCPSHTVFKVLHVRHLYLLAGCKFPLEHCSCWLIYVLILDVVSTRNITEYAKKNYAAIVLIVLICRKQSLEMKWNWVTWILKAGWRSTQNHKKISVVAFGKLWSKFQFLTEFQWWAESNCSARWKCIQNFKTFQTLKLLNSFEEAAARSEETATFCQLMRTRHMHAHPQRLRFLPSGRRFRFRWWLTNQQDESWRTRKEEWGVKQQLNGTVS